MQVWQLAAFCHRTWFICCRRSFICTVSFLHTYGTLFVEQQHEVPSTNWKENEIVEDKQPAGMERGMYIKRIRGLPTMSHGEHVHQTSRTEINKNLFMLPTSTLRHSHASDPASQHPDHSRPQAGGRRCAHFNKVRENPPPPTRSWSLTLTCCFKSNQATRKHKRNEISCFFLLFRVRLSQLNWARTCLPSSHETWETVTWSLTRVRVCARLL